jgi:hypothetical protein
VSEEEGGGDSVKLSDSDAVAFSRTIVANCR